MRYIFHFRGGLLTFTTTKPSLSIKSIYWASVINLFIEISRSFSFAVVYFEENVSYGIKWNKTNQEDYKQIQLMFWTNFSLGSLFSNKISPIIFHTILYLQSICYLRKIEYITGTMGLELMLHISLQIAITSGNKLTSNINHDTICTIFQNSKCSRRIYVQ